MADDPKKPGAPKPPAKTEETTVLGGEPHLVLPAGVRAPAPVGTARQCDPNDRAGDGLRRFKLRLDGLPTGPRTQRYMLATDRDSARAEYLRLEAVPEKMVDPDKGVQVVITDLPD